MCFIFVCLFSFYYLNLVSPDVRGAYFGSMDDKAFEGFTYVGNSGSRYMAAAGDVNSGSHVGGSILGTSHNSRRLV